MQVRIVIYRLNIDPYLVIYTNTTHFQSISEEHLKHMMCLIQIYSCCDGPSPASNRRCSVAAEDGDAGDEAGVDHRLLLI